MQVVGTRRALALPVDTRLASLDCPSSLPSTFNTPLSVAPWSTVWPCSYVRCRSVPHHSPLTVTCCFFFSSTDAILLSKLCLTSVVSGWIKVSHIITLVLEPNIPFPRARAPPQLKAVVIKQAIYSLRKAPYVLRLSLLGYYPFPHTFLLSSYPPLLPAP